jgi:hypothetical protein
VPGSEVLTALATVAGRRDELDRAEWLLVTAARRDGATWAEVAEALGLRSRQAAEQRWLRLRGAVERTSSGGPGPTGRRDPGRARSSREPETPQRERDDMTGLRRAVALLYDLLVQTPAGPQVAPGVRLARQTLAIAGPAPAGALHHLVRHAIDDLQGVPARSLGPDVVDASHRLRHALDEGSMSTLS